MKKIVSLLFFGLMLNAQSIYATFDVEAVKKANLVFTKSNIITTLYADIGDKVKKDSVLAVIKNQDENLSVALANDTVRRNEVEYDYAKKEYERQLKIKNVTNKSTLDSYEKAYKLSKISLSNAKNSLTLKELDFGKTFLKAPFNGVIVGKSLEIGDLSSGVVFTIESNEKKLVLEFDQKYWKEVKVGDVFKYKVDGDSTEYEGKISKIYPYSSSTNRKIKAEVLTKNFPSGLFGDGKIVIK
jgi:multidrug resistance efflux pump